MSRRSHPAFTSEDVTERERLAAAEIRAVQLRALADEAADRRVALQVCAEHRRQGDPVYQARRAERLLRIATVLMAALLVAYTVWSGLDLSATLGGRGDLLPRGWPFIPAIVVSLLAALVLFGNPSRLVVGAFQLAALCGAVLGVWVIGFNTAAHLLVGDHAGALPTCLFAVQVVAAAALYLLYRKHVHRALTRTTATT